MNAQSVPYIFFSKLMRPRPVSLCVLACALALPASLSQALEAWTTPGGMSAPGGTFGDTVATKTTISTFCDKGVEKQMYQVKYDGGLSPPQNSGGIEDTGNKCDPKTEQTKPKPKPAEAATGGLTPAALGIGAAIVGGALAIGSKGDNQGTTNTTSTTGTH